MKKFISFVLVLLMIISTDVSVKAEETPEEVKDNKKISAYGTYEEYLGSGRVVSADIAWDDMTFTYKAERNGVWNPEKHEYEGAEVTGEWASETKSITVVNHSDCVINAKLTFDSVEGLGINGTFTEQSGTENDGVLELNTAIDTAYDQAPSATARFGISGNAITESKALGTITVAVEAVEILDLSLVAKEDYTEKIGKYLAEIDPDKEGNIALNIKLGEETIERQGNAICNALYTYYKEFYDSIPYDQTWTGVVDLSLYGVKTIKAKTFSYTGTGLKSIRFPNATSIESNGLFNCSIMETLIFDKLTELTNSAIVGCTQLVDLRFYSMVTNVQYQWISNPEQIILTLNKNQGSIGSYTTVFSEGEGETGTFGGYTFKEVKQAN